MTARRQECPDLVASSTVLGPKHQRRSNALAPGTRGCLGCTPAPATALHCIASIPTRPYSTAAIIGGTPRRSLPRYLNKRNEKRDPLWAAMTDAHPRFPVVVSFARARPVLPSAHKNLRHSCATATRRRSHLVLHFFSPVRSIVTPNVLRCSFHFRKKSRC